MFDVQALVYFPKSHTTVSTDSCVDRARSFVLDSRPMLKKKLQTTSTLNPKPGVGNFVLTESGLQDDDIIKYLRQPRFATF